MRRWEKRAMLAAVSSFLVITSDMIQQQAPFRDAEADCFDRLQPEDTARHWVQRPASPG
jgi:hypothetical protein